MRIALGLEDHDAGEVRIAGQAPATATASGITGAAFRDAALLPWRTVARNIALPLEVLGRDPARYSHVAATVWASVAGFVIGNIIAVGAGVLFVLFPHPQRLARG